MPMAEITPKLLLDPNLRSIKWRINLGVVPNSDNSTIDDLRHVTADSRRRYASLRRRLLIDPLITRIGYDSSDLVTDNPLSQNPDSTWGRFFRNAELEKMVDKDLTRLYPEHGSYFQTPGCQGLLRRVLLLWCLRHPECGYRQGMHELLAPLIYVLQADIQHLNEVRKLHEDHFVDKFDEDLLNETLVFNFKISSKFLGFNDGFQENSIKRTSSPDLDANLQSIVSLCDPYGADGELGIVLSEKFIEHDAYCMFDALMNGSGGAVAMAEFFSHSPTSATHSNLPPVIEASLALYHLLSIVDPSLYSHLTELGVEPQYFALRWLRVLFGREFSLEDLLIIWDEIFSFSNIKSITSQQDSEISNSPRGAFICALAVSMILNVRSSLLATELATSCLQRLLNFPEQVDLDKVIGKAKSLVPLALDANLSVPSQSVKQTEPKRHTHSVSFDSSSLQTPVNIVPPERYWEEKWRLLQKEEETKNGKSIPQALPKKKGWAEKIKSKLSRTESDPSLAKKEIRDRVKKPAVRRSLLEDLSRHLNPEEDIEESRHDKLASFEDPLNVNSNVGIHDNNKNNNNNNSNISSGFSNASEERSLPVFSDPLNVNSCVVMHDNNSVSGLSTASSGVSTVSEEHSPMFSEPTSPPENDFEKSSVASNITQDITDCETQNSSSFQSTIEEPNLPFPDAHDFNAYGVFGSDDISNKVLVGTLKDRKTLSGKFHWLWKFGRNNSGEGTSDRKIEVENVDCDDVAKLQRNKAETSVSDLKLDGRDQNLVYALRNIGQSMLENIQVLESTFQPERSEVVSQDQLSKHALVEKGQVKAVTALKELRKISNLLREV